MPRATSIRTSTTATTRRRPAQLGLVFRTWGGRRAGAGRKPRPGRRAVPHRRRAPLASRYPVHVTLRVLDELPSLRSPALHRVLEGCFRAARAGGEREPGFQLAHYAVQRHHLHLLVEAHDADCLSRGMQGLEIRIARRLNAALGRRGRVFADRYFPRILRTPREVHHTLRYVLLNCRRHDAQRGRLHGAGWIDPCSSALYFDGWRLPVQPPAGRDPPVAAPRTWLLATGWRRHGLLDPRHVPGPPAPRAGSARKNRYPAAPALRPRRGEPTAH